MRKVLEKTMGNENKRRVLYLTFILILFVSLSGFVSALDVKEFALRHNRLILRQGDVNNDGIVNIFDLAKVGQEYGKTSEDPDWDWKTDVANTVDEINIFDLAKVGQTYGNNYIEEIEDPVFISPAVSNVTANRIFSISVNISTPAEVYAADFIINFDPNLIETVNVTDGDFLNKDEALSHTVKEFNNTLGKIEFASTRIGTQEGVTGNGSLARIEFRAKSVGTGTISFDSLGMVDPNLNEISNVSTINGTVNIDSGEIAPFISDFNIDNPIFSPNNDGKKENVKIDVTASEDVTWKMKIIKGDTICKWGWGTSNYQGSFERTWDGLCQFADEPEKGEYSIEVEMNDTDGNYVVEYLPNIIIDLTKPEIVNIAKTPEPGYNDDDVNLSADVVEENLDSVWLTGNWEGLWKNYSLNSYSYIIDNIYLENQENVSYKFYALDKAGNLNFKVGSFVVSNRKPEVYADNKQVEENSTLEFIVNVNDKDNDFLEVNAENLPDGASFNNNKFIWTPNFTQSGVYEITFNVSDGLSSDSETITVTVDNVNRKPIIINYFPLASPSIDEGESQLFNISLNDPDGDEIIIEWYLNGNYVSGGNSYIFNANHDSQGEHSIKVVASDGDLGDEKEWKMTVNNNMIKVNLKEGTQVFSNPKKSGSGTFKFSELNTTCEVVFGGQESACSGANLAYRDVFTGDWVCLGLNDDLFAGMGYYIKVKNDCWFIANGSFVSQVGYLGEKNVYNTGIYNHTMIGSPSERTKIDEIKGNCNVISMTKYVYGVNSCEGVPEYNGKEEFCWDYPGEYCYCGTDWLNPGEGFFLEIGENCQLE